MTPQERTMLSDLIARVENTRLTEKDPEAEELLKRRFAIIQVWRAINQPIESNPLAIADARSLAPPDLIAAERRYPHRVGETYQIRYNPQHQWFYFPRMRREIGDRPRRSREHDARTAKPAID